MECVCCNAPYLKGEFIMKETNLKTSALFVGTKGFVYQPRTSYSGAGIKWYPEKVKEKIEKK